MMTNDTTASILLDQFRDAWKEFSQATDSEAEWQAKQTARDCAMELALWLMNRPSPTETITELDPIWGNSPDETEIPNDAAGKLTVRDFIVHIHTAAQQSHHSRRAYEQTLLYIEQKEQSAWNLKAEHRFKNAIRHIRATRISTLKHEAKMQRIQQIAAVALGWAVQS